MSASRQTASLWYWIFNEGKHWKRRPFMELVKNPHFFGDSFGCYINRFLICPVFGHKRTQWVDDSNNEKMLYCFSCKEELTRLKMERV